MTYIERILYKKIKYNIKVKKWEVSLLNTADVL